MCQGKNFYGKVAFGAKLCKVTVVLEVLLLLLFSNFWGLHVFGTVRGMVWCTKKLYCRSKLLVAFPSLLTPPQKKIQDNKNTRTKAIGIMVTVFSVYISCTFSTS